MLVANFNVKCQSDFNNFKKTRKFKKYIDRIRKNFIAKLKHKIIINC